MDVGNEIKRLRLSKKLSQRALGRYAGVSDGYISQIESGKKDNVSAQILKKLATRLDVPVEYLLGVAGYIPKQKEEISIQGLQMAKEFDKMDEKGKQHMINTADMIRRKTDNEEKDEAS